MGTMIAWHIFLLSFACNAEESAVTKRLVVIVENMKEGYAEKSQSAYVKLLVDSGFSPTLGIIGEGRSSMGKAWLSDPLQILYKDIKDAVKGVEKHVDIVTMGHYGEGQYLDYRCTHGKHNCTYDPKEALKNNYQYDDWLNISWQLGNGTEIANKIFGYQTSTFMTPRLYYKDKQMRHVGEWKLSPHTGGPNFTRQIVENALQQRVLTSITGTDFNEGDKTLLSGSPAWCGQYSTMVGNDKSPEDIWFLPVGARTNTPYNEKKKHCKVRDWKQIKQSLNAMASACKGVAVLVVSPQDIAGENILSPDENTCKATDSTEIANMKEFFKQLSDDKWYPAKYCEGLGVLAGTNMCPSPPTFPDHNPNWRIYLVKGISFSCIGMIGFSFIASVCNWMVFASALRWAGCRCSKYATEIAKHRDNIGIPGVILIGVGLLVYNLVMLYLLTFFILSQFRGWTDIALFAPMHWGGYGTDFWFGIWAAIMVTPNFLIIALSLRSVQNWTKWARCDGDFKEKLETPVEATQALPGIAEEEEDEKLPKIVVQVPIYQEDEGAFMRMVQSATHQTYSEHGRTHLVELFIVFDGQTKNNQPLQRSRKCKKAIDLYLCNRSRPDDKYYSAKDPKTGVKVHVFVPEWGGKWVAQRNAWTKMCDVYRAEEPKPHILFIDSDCRMKPDACHHLARCMSEPRAAGPYNALAGHVKVEMLGQYNFLWKLQEADFIISQMMVRGAEEMLGGCTCLPGAFCMMRWKAFEQEADQYFREVDKENYWDYSMVHIAEDRYLTLLLLLKGQKHSIGYCPLAEVTTECPGDMTTLVTQRRRWYLSAMVNDLPMVLRRSMWKRHPMLMIMRIYFLITSAAPANSFIVGVLGVVQLAARNRSPSLNLLYITVVPTYICMILYSVMAKRRGPILYFPLFQLFMPLFSMMVALKAFNAWIKDDRGWGGAREAGQQQAAAAAAAAAEQTPVIDDEGKSSVSSAGLDKRDPLLSDGSQDGSHRPATGTLAGRSNGSHAIGSMGMRGSLSTPGSMREKASIAALDWTLHSLSHNNSFREPIHDGPLETEEESNARVEEVVNAARLSPYLYNKEEEDELRKDSMVHAEKFIRMLGAIHVVAFHYYKALPGNINKVGFIPAADDNDPMSKYCLWITWGGQWVQFFFVTGGFMMTYSRMLSRRGMEDTAYSVWKSSFTKLYAPFFLSILLFLWNDERAIYLYWRSLPSTLTLTFGWGGIMYCNPPTIDGKEMTDSIEKWKHFNRYVCDANANEPAWYLCSLQAFWVAYPLIFRWISTRKLEKVIALMFCLLGWTLFWPLVTTIDWVEQYDQWGEPLQTIRAYHPVSHVHKFMFGMCAARCFVDIFCRPRKDAPNGKMFISETQINRVAEARFFAPVGWICILCLFCFTDKDAFQCDIPWLGRLAAQDLFLLPLFAMVIVGAAIQRDPITKLMNMPPLSWIGNLEISYEVYILQGPVMNFMTKLFTAKWMLPNVPDSMGHLSDEETLQNEAHWVGLVRWLYLPALFFVSFMVNRYCTRPIAVFMSSGKEKVVKPPAAAAATSSA